MPRDADETYDHILSILHRQISNAAQADWLKSHDLRSVASLSRALITRPPPMAPSSGFLERQLRCTRCWTPADTKLESFNRLSVSMPPTVISADQYDEVDLLACLKEVSGREEVLDGVWCPNCSQTTRQRLSFHVARFPQILCIHLKRLGWCSETGLPVRDDRAVRVYTRFKTSFLEAKGRQVTPPGWEYHLRAVILHFDKIGHSGGHYTCLRYVQRRKERGFASLTTILPTAHDDGAWFYVNDDNVTLTSLHQHQSLKNAYMLLFELVKGDSRSIAEVTKAPTAQ